METVQAVETDLAASDWAPALRRNTESRTARNILCWGTDTTSTHRWGFCGGCWIGIACTLHRQGGNRARRNHPRTLMPWQPRAVKKM